jgi:hypothetical protein
MRFDLRRAAEVMTKELGCLAAAERCLGHRLHECPECQRNPRSGSNESEDCVLFRGLISFKSL